ncbi:thioesterase II family protein [Algicola sagamiensis]|uniref:thioesterase II family protein n=1 Tax=Algicola sagamiensis TaxID=163869 RepID=UPI00035C83D0|nr:thioesterase domain-containing protein [Algicola sagamiensis]
MSSPTCVIYAFPHAGAGAGVYRPWQNKAKDHASFVFQPVEIPGRGSLGNQSSIQDLTLLAEVLAENIVADFRRQQEKGITKWMTFGHSFGGVISAVVTEVLHRKYQMLPMRSVISGAIAPCVQDLDDLHTWSDAQILQKMKDDQATPLAILNEPALSRRLVAQLRDDYIVRSQFVTMGQLQVAQPLTLISATQDVHIPLEKMTAWENHTSATATLVRIDGDHFAIYQHWHVAEQAFIQPKE